MREDNPIQRLFEDVYGNSVSRPDEAEVPEP